MSILGGASAVSAAPRSVAIVNVAQDQAAGAELADRLRRAIDREESIEPLRAGELSRGLEEALATSTRPQRLRMARERLAGAGEALEQLRYAEVFQELERAEALLLALEPSTDVLRLLADVAFMRGDAYLQDNRPVKAELELRAVHRLDPTRTSLDPARHRPALVLAFDAAGVSAASTATLHITSPFDGATVYINGHQSGATPALTQVPPGVHYVTGTLPGDQVIGERVVLPTPHEKVTVKLQLTRVTVDDKARYERRRLLEQKFRAPRNDANLRRAVRRAANLTGVKAIVIVGQDERGSLWLAAYDVSSEEFGSWQRAANHSERVLLQRLGLIPPPALDLAPLPPTDRTPRRPGWWTGNRIKAGVAFGFIASIVGLSLYQLRPQSEPSTVSGASCCDVSDGSR